MEIRQEDIKQTLKNILLYIDADIKYVEDAELQSMLERLVRRHV